MPNYKISYMESTLDAFHAVGLATRYVPDVG